MTSWLLYSVITGAFVALAAQGAEWLLKSARRSVRTVWFAAIALTVAFSLTAPLRVKPAVQYEVVESQSASPLPIGLVREATWFESLTAFANSGLQRLTEPLKIATESAAAVPEQVNVVARIGAFATAIIALLVLLTVYARSMRERIKWPRMRLLGRRVRVTPNVGPAVLGLAPPEIVVPQWVLLRNVEEQRLVLEHESEHVRAHDPLLLMIACIAVACLPWNPALWFMWSRLRLAVELDCDRRVLLRGVQKPAYGQLLVELSSSRPWTSPAIPAFSWGTSHLEQRLVAMTARPQRFRLLRRVASGFVVAAALVAAGLAELPVPAELQAMDASHLTRGVGESASPLVDGNFAVSNDADRTRLEAPAASETSRQVSSQDTIPKRKVQPPDSAARKPVLRRATAQVASKDSSPLARRKLEPRTGTARIASRDTAPLVRRKVNPQPGRVGLVDSISYKQLPGAAGDSVARTYYLKSAPVAQDSTPGLKSFRVSRVDSTNSVTMLADTLMMRDATGGTLQGTDSRIRIRGQQSMTINSDPLIIVDGYVVTTGLKDLDPSSIASVEVVKGAKAVSLYGAVAANGVIIVTTKRP